MSIAEKELALTLLRAVRDSVANGKGSETLFHGLRLLIEFHAVPTSVAATFQRASEVALVKERGSNAADMIFETSRKDIVVAFDYLIQRLENTFVVLQAMERVAEHWQRPA